MAIEEIEPTLSDRVEQWSKQLREEGKAEGRAEGAATLREVAQRLLVTGMTISEVAEVTDLTEEDVIKVRDTAV